MTFARDPVEDESSQAHRRVEYFKSTRHGSQTAGTGACIQDQYDWQAQEFCDFGTAALFARTGHAVEQTHHAFDERKTCTGGCMKKNSAIRVAAQHPRIEIAARSPADCRMMSPIDEVGAALKWLHDDSPRSQAGHDRKGHRRL